jgi:hypothetical protein
MKTAKEICECPKCGGSGYIQAFAGIANGTCFRCAGTGKVAYRASKKMLPALTPYMAGIIETIKNADLSVMSYKQLSSLRDAAHYPTPHCPELLAIWRERGEEHFQAAQNERLAAY